VGKGPLVKKVKKPADCDEYTPYLNFVKGNKENHEQKLKMI